MMRRLRRIGDHVYSLLRVPALRFALVQARLRWFLAVRGLRQFSGHGSAPVTVAHNMKSLKAYNTRNEALFLSCAILEDLRDAAALVIGGRTEEEYYIFRAYGLREIEMLDLISYSPKVRLGDMHALPYADDRFDLVFCAYTLAYSETPSRAASEMLRVVRDGGHVAIAIEYSPPDQRAEAQQALLGYTITPDRGLNSVGDILALFEGHVGEVVLRYDAAKKRFHSKAGLVPRPSPVAVIFSVRK